MLNKQLHLHLYISCLKHRASWGWFGSNPIPFQSLRVEEARVVGAVACECVKQRPSLMWLVVQNRGLSGSICTTVCIWPLNQPNDCVPTCRSWSVCSGRDVASWLLFHLACSVWGSRQCFVARHHKFDSPQMRTAKRAHVLFWCALNTQTSPQSL